ncbi:kinase-regulated stress-responsive transcription factor skn7 [Yamadazyma tenuis]|uniref:Transcription factor n=1 Tax=Candida tenuis (strain ATCC 10573 / BCRC 21748 / CBS 615 / JCM 9827 / NBRC 10315 / NRRL Y-1498 / VKM Y-70) TaxID=590646 RepID=G3B5I8_CANTC|nr:uncharacterized protein CANTEDRAFT_106719 [Yamadazyma tenuis ATCC 10573]EGV63239.1 hypothetical protein CANTEDRAFT_106719 [Yamadazyma tenuis ATCC 10573]WEJ96944.1 kinase-regulated stress-responsive transcription factor skn7 [Yamadazyma tenuis]
MSKVIKSEEPSDSLHPTSSSHQGGSNDFVKKLFQMLQEDSYKNVVRWTKDGDSFVVIDTNEFTKEILPRHFKHSNLASFVRQLNKYDFHKVKISNEAKRNYEYGDDAWEFKHPEFRVNDREALDNIKRKGTNSKKSAPGNGGALVPSSVASEALFQRVMKLEEQVEYLQGDNTSLSHQLSTLKSKYKHLMDHMVTVKSFEERNFNSINLMINSLAQMGIKLPPLDFPNPDLIGNTNGSQAVPGAGPTPTRLETGTVPSAVTQAPTQSYGDKLDYAFSGPQSLGQGLTPQQPIQSQQTHSSHTRNQSHTQLQSPDAAAPIAQPTPAAFGNGPTSLVKESQSPQNRPVPANTPPSQSIITTSIPNPKFHVLLVEDDNVCIQLCRKFLVKYGCQVTVVTDGLNAISTVEKTKYDLVLMDIVMPNLDGATATSVIRSFDTRTPIIAMTGNIEDNDLVNYLQNGMSDILAKPFTKDDLYSILAKHLLTGGSSSTTAPSSVPAPPQQSPPSDDQTSMVQAPAQSPVHASDQPAVPQPSDFLSGGVGDPLLKKQRLQ